MTPRSTGSSRDWTGTLVPLVLVIGLVADGASRFLSLDVLAIRAWEAMSRNAFMEGGVPFEPSKHYVNDRSSGDLAAATNQPAFREYRREEFTSDAWGYRNATTFAPDNPPDAILVGTSFSVGSGVSDDETLAAQLGRLTHSRIYNAAGGAPVPERIRSIAERLGMKKGTVILELLESNGVPGSPPPTPRLHQVCMSRLGTRCLTLKGWLRASPVKIATQRAYRKLENDLWLPNPSANTVSVHRFPEGDAMLIPPGTNFRCRADSEEGAVTFFRSLQAGLPGLDLFVVLVPEKASVYGDPLSLVAPSERCLTHMGRALASLSIPYVDLSDRLRDAARAETSPGHRLFFLDDTHWNRFGIGTAATMIALHWPTERQDAAKAP